jgi:ABC-type multidrug transport system fused ATPase/permease subunit
VSTGLFGGNNEFRIYDFTTLIFYYYAFVSPHSNNILSVARKSKIFKYFYKLCLWASFMSIPTILYAFSINRFVYVGMTVIFLHHLWGFFLLPVFISQMSSSQLKKYIYFAFIISSLHLLLYYSQTAGIVGHLWPKIYIQAYGEQAYSGTLGPNRITPGMFTFFGLIISIGILLVFKPKNKILRLGAYANAFFAVPAMMLIGSRTTFVGLLVFSIIYLFYYNIKWLIVLLISFPILLSASYSLLNEKQITRIQDQIDYNERKLLKGEESIDNITVVDAYENLGTGRVDIIKNFIPFLVNNIFILPTGFGFNNRMVLGEVGAGSAHNMYLTIIAELGLIGAFFYFNWLFSYYSLLNLRVLKTKKHPARGIIVAFTFAMAVTLFAGEHLYPYRPCFAIMGAFHLIIFMFTRQMTNELSQKAAIKRV